MGGFDMYETAGKLIRVDKKDAEVMYYNGMGIMIVQQKINPLHEVANKTVYKYSELKRDFDKLLNETEYYNGKVWFWAESNNKGRLDDRRKQYRRLKSYKEMYKKYGIDLDNPADVDRMNNKGINEEHYYVNVVFDYIIKYKPVSINCLSNPSEMEYLYKFLESFDYEGYLLDNNRDKTMSVMRSMGFR